MSWRERLLVSRAEAALILGCSIKKIDRLCRAGKIRAKKEGRQVQLLTASLIEYVDSTSPAPEAVAAEPLSEDERVLLARMRAGSRG
jgi:hypothetical protein